MLTDDEKAAVLNDLIKNIEISAYRQSLIDQYVVGQKPSDATAALSAELDKLTVSQAQVVQ